jgi:hypothetical protein
MFPQTSGRTRRLQMIIDHRPDWATKMNEPYLCVQQRVSPELSQSLCGDDNDVAHSSLASYYGLGHFTTRTAFLRQVLRRENWLSLMRLAISGEEKNHPLFSWTKLSRVLFK